MAEQQNPSATTSGTARPRNTRPARANFLSEYKGDSIVIQVLFKNQAIVNGGYRAHFDGLSSAVFFMRGNLRSLRDNALNQQSLQAITDSLAAAERDIKEKLGIAQALIKKHNIQARQSPNGDKRNVTVIDPLANRFLQLIIKADQAAAAYNTLWFSLVFTDEQRNQANNELLRAISNVHTFARQLNNGLRKLLQSQSNAGAGGDASEGPENHSGSATEEGVDGQDGLVGDGTSIPVAEDPQSESVTAGLADDLGDDLGDDDLTPTTKAGAAA